MNTHITKRFSLFFSAILFAGMTYAQSSKAVAARQTNLEEPLTSLTQLMLKKTYAAQTLSDMQANHPEKLQALNYYYSKSFKVKEGQKYSDEQLLKIDVSQLDKYRLADGIKEVKDAVSGLTLLLDSQNTVKKAVQHFMETKDSPEKAKN